MSRAFRLGLDALQRDAPGGCRGANDGEPVLIAIGFHGTFGAAGPPEVWRLPLAGAARPGGAVGTFTFPGSHLAAGGVQIMGAAVIAVAHDSTPLTIIAAEADAAVSALRERLAPVLRHACPAFWNPADGQTRIAAAAGVVVDAITYGLLRRLGGFAASMGVPDDQFDAQFLCYTDSGLRCSPGISALRAGETTASFGGPFTGYRLRARLGEFPAG